MPLDFPNDPVVGDIFAGAGARWLWDGAKWTSLMTSGGPFLPLTGGALTGPLMLAADPAVALHAATKQYVDAGGSGYLPLTGGELSGPLMLTAMSTVIPPAGVGLLQGHAVNGTVIQGSGSATDFMLNNKNGTAVMSVPTGTVNLAAAGLVNTMRLGAPGGATGTGHTVIGPTGAGASLTTGSNNVIIGGNSGSTIAALSGNMILSDGAGNIRASYLSATSTWNFQHLDIGDNANGMGVFDNSSALTVKGNPTYTTTANPIFQVNCSMVGTITSGNPWLNVISFTDKVSATLPGAALYGLYINHAMGSGSTWTGGRIAGRCDLNVTNTPASSGVSAGTFFNAFSATSTASVNLGGTGTGGSSAGSIQGGVFQGVASGTATFLHQVTGVGISANVTGGASAQYVMALQIGCGLGAGSSTYNAIELAGDTGTVPFNIGISFGSPVTTLFPVASTGTLIGAVAGTPSGNRMSAAYGIDWSLVAFGTGFLKSTGFLVDGSGNTSMARAGFNGVTAIAKPTVSGAKASNAALASLIAALASYGLITDTTTA